MSFIDLHADSACFQTLLQQKGVFEALHFINSKSVHRFTALYCFDGPILRNVCLVDKNNDSIRKMEAIEVADSYCLYVRGTGRKFLVPDSLVDGRVLGHPKREIIRSYCGVPLNKANALMIGTICHFDFQPVPCLEEEMKLLELISPSLVDTLVTSLIEKYK